jgi:hypothetical protein
MSKKNKKSTKRNRHANDLRRATQLPLSKRACASLLRTPTSQPAVEA